MKNEAKTLKVVEKQQAFNLVDAITSPIIVADSDWGKDLPENLRRDIKLARMAKNIEILKDGKREATIPEIVAYLMTASLSGPLSEQWARIYMYVCREYMIRWTKVPEDNIPEFLGKTKLSNYDMAELEKLAIWIYEKRRKELRIKK